MMRLTAALAVLLLGCGERDNPAFRDADDAGACPAGHARLCVPVVPCEYDCGPGMQCEQISPVGALGVLCRAAPDAGIDAAVWEPGPGF